MYLLNGGVGDLRDELSGEHWVIDNPHGIVFATLDGLVIYGNGQRNHLRHRADLAADGEGPVLKDTPDSFDRCAEFDRGLV